MSKKKKKKYTNLFINASLVSFFCQFLYNQFYFQMFTTRSNSSLISSRTRSRSNSVSSVASSIEEPSYQVAQSAPIMESSLQTTGPSTTDITSALVKSLRVIGATNTWDNVRNDVKKLSADVTRCEERITRVEEKVDRILGILLASPQVVEAPVMPSEGTYITPGTSKYNELSVSYFF